MLISEGDTHVGNEDTFGHSTLSVDIPASAADGDVLIAIGVTTWASSPPSLTIAALAGWSSLGSAGTSQLTGVINHQVKAFLKVVSGDAGDTLAWDLQGTGIGYGQMTVLSFPAAEADAGMVSDYSDSASALGPTPLTILLPAGSNPVIAGRLVVELAAVYPNSGSTIGSDVGITANSDVVEVCRASSSDAVAPAGDYGMGWAVFVYNTEGVHPETSYTFTTNTADDMYAGVPHLGLGRALAVQGIGEDSWQAL